MTVFYFIRHGEADWSLADEEGFSGAQRDFVPLTLRGVEQAETAACDPRLHSAQLILSSPYTRALQTAAVINGKLGLPILVEYDLREWIPDVTFGVTSSKQVRDLSVDYDKCGGKHPDGAPRLWETKADLKKRVDGVLYNYLDYECVIVVCHGMVIRSQVAVDEISPGEIVEYRLPPLRPV